MVMVPCFRIAVANLPRSSFRLKPSLLLAFGDFTVGQYCRDIVGVNGRSEPGSGDVQRAQALLVQTVVCLDGGREDKFAKVTHVIVKVAPSVKREFGSFPKIKESAALRGTELPLGKWVASLAVLGCSAFTGDGVEDDVMRLPACKAAELKSDPRVAL